MARRVGMRGRTDFRVTARWGRRVARCRGIEVSSTGIVVHATELVMASPLWVWLELELPERLRPMLALARPVWSFGDQQALKFVRLPDADRLSLAEHVDLLSHRGLPLH